MKKLILCFSLIFSMGKLFPQCALSILGNNTVCAGACTALTASFSVVSPATYTWLPSGLNTSTISVCPGTNTTYTVCGSTQSGCNLCQTVTVIVNPLPVLSIQPQSASGCLPVCVNYANTTTVTGTCTWDFGDGTSSTSCNATHCWVTAGTYSPTLTLTDNNGCVNSDTALVNVYAVPAASFTYALSSCCNDGFFMDSSYIAAGDSIVAWNWAFMGGHPSTSTSQNPGTIYLDLGVDTVCLIVTSAHGCKDSTCQLVNETIASVKELNNSLAISIYHNPANDRFFIETNPETSSGQATTGKLTVDLFDVNGSHLFSKSVNGRSNISVADINEGVYTVIIKTTDRVINKKLVIVR